jgi:hypothetical protein
MKYLSKDGICESCVQYECANIPQVKNTIAKITHTRTTTEEWREMCQAVKKSGGCDSKDYIYFIGYAERECSVFIGYDKDARRYLVWVELN